ncbi:hypothetical protein [Rhizobium freirei]|uniref:hypothetical protein n=1 Tax=Rhizobium freirei TaxID=1353277 RepID=UPI001427E617|nr:hypothetical protein [Rhizobium freirei]
MGKKKRATGINQGPYRCEGQNLQRGTANAVELGGKATVCISCVRYDANLCSAQCFFVHGSYAFAAPAAEEQKKRAAGVNQGPIGMKVKNLQRGTANAVELGGKPPCASAECDMVVKWAGFNSALCISAMRHTRG